MKKIKFILLLVAFSMQFINAQQKGGVTSISASTKTIGTSKVNYISKSKLMEGTNSVKLASGKIISVILKSGNITSATMDGVTYKLSGNTPGAGFICTPLQCECHGIDDCNDMFGPNGPCKSCIECAICDENDNCVCIRATKKAPTSNKNKDIKATTSTTKK
ncbi:MAG: hypothetical protein IPO78_09710 [Saprospiraceae bacterium]|nr:hypothetical protein [Saprospiraceae bacterium]MBK9721873.1 hypothetical protein [Saprospiraceae bacterium]